MLLTFTLLHDNLYESDSFISNNYIKFKPILLFEDRKLTSMMMLCDYSDYEYCVNSGVTYLPYQARHL